ncbi:MAG: HipA domain-containing protein [Clostridiales bacterium]|jgi:hypothetical protein|nr:HipA domain-containing protein [Clostridiales bacterium]
MILHEELDPGCFVNLNGHCKKKLMIIGGKKCVVKFLGKDELCNEYMAFLIARHLSLSVAETSLFRLESEWRLSSELAGRLDSGTTIIREAGFLDFDTTKLKAAGFSYSYDEIVKLLQPNEQDQFWELCMLDCIISNADRHSENWGRIGAGLSPSYDHHNAFENPISSEYSLIRLSNSDVTLEKLAASLFHINPAKFDLYVNRLLEINLDIFDEMFSILEESCVFDKLSAVSGKSPSISDHYASNIEILKLNADMLDKIRYRSHANE